MCSATPAIEGEATRRAIFLAELASMPTLYFVHVEDAGFVCAPPLRTQEHRDRLWWALSANDLSESPSRLFGMHPAKGRSCRDRTPTSPSSIREA